MRLALIERTMHVKPVRVRHMHVRFVHLPLLHHHRATTWKAVPSVAVAQQAEEMVRHDTRIWIQPDAMRHDVGKGDGI